MTIPEARTRGVHIPTRVTMYWPDGCPGITWPVIRFNRSETASGQHHELTLISGMYIDVMGPNDKLFATRHQVPLILAWVRPVLRLLSFADCDRRSRFIKVG
jgi:hypothetical protein